eukprot:scaffold1020_cov176-Chaetoceros_neogracile.AAC.2
MTEKSNAYSQVVAICGVPPEQVPEGILNFARSYGKEITYVKVLIMNNDQQNNEELPDGRLPSNPNPNPNPNTPDRSSHHGSHGRGNHSAPLVGIETDRHPSIRLTQKYRIVLYALIPWMSTYPNYTESNTTTHNAIGNSATFTT